VAGLEQGERVLASGSGPEGELVATSRRLILPSGSLGWDEIERATWDGDERVLDVYEVARSADRPMRRRIAITEPGRLVDVVREQVTASVVISRHVAIRGRHGVRVTGRRRSDGGITWIAALDPGIDSDDPATRAQIDSAVASVRSTVE
jgi:hypothetical protein